MGSRVVLLCLALVSSIIPLLTKDPYLLHVLILIAVFSIISLSVRLVFITGQWNFGQSAFALIGMYTSVFLVVHLGISFWIAFFLSGLSAAVVALLFGYPSLRLKGAYFGMVTMSLILLVQQTIIVMDSLTGGIRGFDHPIPLPDPIRFFGHMVEFSPVSKVPFYYLIWALSVFTILVMYRLDNSRLGLIYRAIQQNTDLAESVGLDSLGYRVQVFVIGAFFTGLTGSFLAHYLQLAHPNNFSLWTSIYVVAYAVLGGMSSVVGPIVGASLMIGTFELLRPVPAYQSVGYAAVMLVVVRFLPHGLIGLAPPGVAGMTRLIRKVKALVPGRNEPAAPTKRTDMGSLRGQVPAQLARKMAVKKVSLDSSASMKSEADAPLLEVINLTKRFGGLLALESVNFQVGQGEFLGVIGPNGAGKTTLFNVLSSVYRPEAGKVMYEGRDISRLKFHEVALQGIVRTFQSNALFPEMTTLENVIVAHQLRAKARWWDVLFDTGLARRERSDVEQSAICTLESLGLVPLGHELAKSLPHGHQRKLGVAIALAAHPELLMLDEPVTGMTPGEVKTMLGILQGLKDRGITILLVEHNMGAVMSICDRIVVLNHGRKIAEGVPEEVAENRDVVEAYLGTDEDLGVG